MEQERPLIAALLEMIEAAPSPEAAIFTVELVLKRRRRTDKVNPGTLYTQDGTLDTMRSHLMDLAYHKEDSPYEPFDVVSIDHLLDYVKSELLAGRYYLMNEQSTRPDADRLIPILPWLCVEVQRILDRPPEARVPLAQASGDVYIPESAPISMRRMCDALGEDWAVEWRLRTPRETLIAYALGRLHDRLDDIGGWVEETGSDPTGLTFNQVVYRMGRP